MDEAARWFGLFIVEAAASDDQSGGWERDAERLAAVLAILAREASDRDREDWRSRLDRTRAILQVDSTPEAVEAEVDAWARVIHALEEGTWGPRQAELLLERADHARKPKLGDLVSVLTHLSSKRGPVNRHLAEYLRRVAEGREQETGDLPDQGRPLSPWEGVGTLMRREPPSLFDPEATTGEAQPRESATWERSTRNRVVRLILDHGPSTVADLAERLGLTQAAVRRHLDSLVHENIVEAREQRVYGQRTRGRPAKVFALTDYGRYAFEQSYDVLAEDARRWIEAETASGEGSRRFPFLGMESGSQQPPPERHLRRADRQENEFDRRQARLWDDPQREEDFPEPPATFDGEDIAPAAATLDHALAALFLRLGPPPSPTEQDFAPVGTGDGGAQV